VVYIGNNFIMHGFFADSDSFCSYKEWLDNFQLLLIHTTLNFVCDKVLNYHLYFPIYILTVTTNVCMEYDAFHKYS